LHAKKVNIPAARRWSDHLPHLIGFVRYLTAICKPVKAVITEKKGEEAK